jgi:DNA-binding XRE family transcriptional regulator
VIVNDADYQRSRNLAAQLHNNILQQEQNFLSAGLTTEQTSEALKSACALFHQLSDDAELYAGIKRGEYNEDLFRHLGYLLTMLRIAHNVTQEQLARILNCSVSEIDFNERNDYPQLTLERGTEILVALSIYVT